MLAQRCTQQLALRRQLLTAVSQRNFLLIEIAGLVQKPVPLALTRNINPAAFLAISNRIQSRSAASQIVPNDEAYQILARQRLNRPVSPHLSIYRPQITWYASALNRITGSVLSGGFYVFGAAYLVAPLFGWHLESSTMAAAFAELPTVVKVLLKFGVALPFTFHSFNGVRHLVWDTGREFSNKSVQRTGWVVVGLSVVTAGGLAAIGN